MIQTSQVSKRLNRTPLFTVCFPSLWLAGCRWVGAYTHPWTSILLYCRDREFAQDVYTLPKYCETLLRGQLPKHWGYPGNLNRYNIRRCIQPISAPTLDLLNGSQTPSALPKVCGHPTVLGRHQHYVNARMNTMKPISLLSRSNDLSPLQEECSSGTTLPFFVRPTFISQANAAHSHRIVRYNALSRALEAALQRESIPNRVLSGVKFFERLEIKDLLAYLQLIDNPNYGPAFLRVINVPKRQIGETVCSTVFVDLRHRAFITLQSIEQIVNAARKRGISPMALVEKIAAGRIPDTQPSVRSKVQSFVKVINSLSVCVNKVSCFSSGVSISDEYSGDECRKLVARGHRGGKLRGIFEEIAKRLDCQVRYPYLFTPNYRAYEQPVVDGKMSRSLSPSQPRASLARTHLHFRKAPRLNFKFPRGPNNSYRLRGRRLPRTLRQIPSLRCLMLSIWCLAMRMKTKTKGG